MGASSWSYFVLYQEDIAQALNDLRQQVFETGEYSKFGLLEGFEYLLDELYPPGTLSKEERAGMVSAYSREETIHIKEVRFDPPRTVDDLVERYRPALTQSVIDMMHVVSHSESCAVAPLPNTTLQTLFGTQKPARTVVEQILKRRKRIDLVSEGDGVYIIVYEHDRPSEIFFQGEPGWSYFVPYQENIEQALQDLRLLAFEKGEYSKKPLKDRIGYVLEWLYHPEKLNQVEIDHMLSTCHKETIYLEEVWIRPPQTADEVARRCGPSGTHSVIDIAKISSFPENGAFSPLSVEGLLELFGTDKPTRAMIEQVREQCGMCSSDPRGEGTYIIVYKDDRPDEIYFEGYSGD